MNKGDFCQDLFDDIKDDIEFDSDVMALKSLLLVMIEINEEKSFENWEYLLLNIDFNNLERNIDFKPLLKDYPEKLFITVGAKKFFNYIENIPLNKAKVIYDYIFNIYNPNCFIYQSLRYYIEKNDNKEERNIIQSILAKSNNFSKLIFDKTELIKRVIFMHIESKKIPLDFINELINGVENKKDRAVLKSLIIDYLMF